MGRVAFILCSTLIWFAGSIWWYTCQIKQVCGTMPKVESSITSSDDKSTKSETVKGESKDGDSTPADEVKDLGPVVFEFSDANAITNEKFAAYKDKIKAGLTDENILEIVGHYYSNETKPDGFENIGLARAEDIKNLFLDMIPEDRMKLISRNMGEAGDDIKKGKLGSLFSLRWTKEEEKVIEMEDSAIIYFNFNSTKRIKDPEIEDYLKKVASRVLKSNEAVQLVGHTDDIGGDETNHKLGMRRAKKISDVLRGYGVSSSKIKINSRGELEPIATNKTERGRDQNRRVELSIK
jgi:flagellar motor protein MotB